MIILVLNCGSSSLKYQLFDMEREAVWAKGVVERIGLKGSILSHRVPGRDNYLLERDVADHHQAIGQVLAVLVDQQHGVIKDIGEIQAVGHRVAHGGHLFDKSAVIDAKTRADIAELIELAPLHNPANLAGIDACSAIMPGIPQVAVFDTAFHQTLPPSAYLYGLPYEFYEEHGIRKYGFHGTSHRYVAQRAAEKMGRDLSELKLITCHLGNGASVTAIEGGRSVETSMGFTPLEGLTMGTRCGDLDPAIVTFLMDKKGWSTREINDLLNKKSGVLGISGVSSDFRDLEEASAKGNQRAKLAIEVFVHDVRRYIGAYTVVLGGVDAVVFTAGVGENSPAIRAAVCRQMEFLGISMDEQRNAVRGQEAIISPEGSRCTVMVIPTNEELMIARDTLYLVR